MIWYDVSKQEDSYKHYFTKKLADNTLMCLSHLQPINNTYQATELQIYQHS